MDIKHEYIIRFFYCTILSQNTRADHYILRFGHEIHSFPGPISSYYDERKMKQFFMIV